MDLGPETEKILWEGKPLAYIIRSGNLPNKTTFLTPPEFKQQVGYVVHSKGSEIKRHVHKDLERNLIGTSEVLILLKGQCVIEIYNDDRILVESRDLYQGDIMLMVGGGHGFKMVEDTVFLEIKQGPYSGVDEKEHF